MSVHNNNYLNIQQQQLLQQNKNITDQVNSLNELQNSEKVAIQQQQIHQQQQVFQPQSNLIVGDNQKKYNTIDIQNNNDLTPIQTMAHTNIVSNGQSVQAANIFNVGQNPIQANDNQQGQNKVAQPAITQDTAGTSNPSNEINCNSEYIDIMRKIPRILCERYELLDILGKGAHGRIYLAIDLITHDRVAIKLMEKTNKNKSKFQREISLMKDMMKLAKKKPLKENLIKYQEPETVQQNAKIQQQILKLTSGQIQTSTNKSRRIGFPRLYSYCSDQNYYYLVMQLLGLNLKELKESFKESKFSIQTTTIIALQLMNRLQSIHSQGYIHRDLKPANVVIGNDSNEAHFIYLIDFGLAKKESSSNPVQPADSFKNTLQLDNNAASGSAEELEKKENIIDPKTGKKKTATQTLKEFMLNEKDNFRVVGTAMYAALAAHLPDKKYLKKDDIESLLYLLSYFGVGQLPWRYKTNQEGLEKMMHYKFEIKSKELFPPNIFPPQYAKLYEYIRYIPDDQEADYAYIEKELLTAAQIVKIDQSLLITLDWMSSKPIVTEFATPQNKNKFQQQNLKSTSPGPQNKNTKISVSSQLQKNNNQGVYGLKTPLITDKSKKQQFSMTPELQIKTYAEKSGLGVIANGLNNNGLQGVGVIKTNAYANTLQSTSKNQNFSIQQNAQGANMMGLTVGGESLQINNNQYQLTNNSNLGMYAQNNIDQQIIQQKNLNSIGNIDEEIINEDSPMLNIPREGNADLLNKSTKLTLSSKKQYESTLQNYQNIQQNNKMDIGGSNQYTIQAYENQNQTMMQGQNQTNQNNLNAQRQKINSTMMSKFNQQVEKSINQRNNLNKSTLLPNNVNSQNVGVNMHFNSEITSRNMQNQLKVGNVIGHQKPVAGESSNNFNSSTNQKNMLQFVMTSSQANRNIQDNNNVQQIALDHLNRSLNIHQTSMAFSNNQSYQQSPPNIQRNNINNYVPSPMSSNMQQYNNQVNKNINVQQYVAGKNLNNQTQSQFQKVNNLFDKNLNNTLKVSGAPNIQNNQMKQNNGAMNNGMYIVQNTGMNNQQTSNQNQMGNNNQVVLPHGPGALNGMQTKTAWNTQNLNQTLNNVLQMSQKNKDRYVLQQQNNKNDLNNAVGINKNIFTGSSQVMTQNLGNVGLIHNQNNIAINSVDIQQLQNTLSPTNAQGGILSISQQERQQQLYLNQNIGSPNFVNNMSAISTIQNSQKTQNSEYQNSNYKNLKILNSQQQQHQYKATQQNKTSQQEGTSQFGSRLSHNTNMSGNTSIQKKKNSIGINNSALSVPNGLRLQYSNSPAKNVIQQANQISGNYNINSSMHLHQQQQILVQQTQSLQQNRQSKNSSALGIIGGAIVNNVYNFNENISQGADSQSNNQTNQQQQQQSQFMVNRGQLQNKTNMLYNTMQQNNNNTIKNNIQGVQNTIQSTGDAINQIHIKIEDQTGLPGKAPQLSQINGQTPAVKKQLLQSSQKFGTAIKAQHNVQLKQASGNQQAKDNKSGSQNQNLNQTLNFTQNQNPLNVTANQSIYKNSNTTQQLNRIKSKGGIQNQLSDSKTKI